MIKQRTNPTSWLSIEGVDLSVNEFPDGSFRFSLGVFSEQELFNVTLKTTLPEALHAAHQVCCVIADTYPKSKINLIIQTLPDQRADRVEDFGMAIPILTTSVFLSMMPVDQIEVFDVHSTSGLLLLNDCLQRMGIKLKVNSPKSSFLAVVKDKPGAVVAVDKGAVGRAESVAYDFNAAVIYMDKARDVNGSIIGHEIYEVSKAATPLDNIWIVDDLCDGGATFISAAKAVKKRYPQNSINLYVTHGLFSKGKKELYKYFDNITAFFDYSKEQN